MAGGSKSKNKGSAYERDLCKLLGETFGGTFIRSTNSGAFLGGKNAGRKAGLSEAQIAGQKGDVVTPAHMPKLVVEAKAYADFRFHQLVQKGRCGQLDDWMKQVLDASDPGDISMICFKINRKGSFVAVPGILAKELTLGNHANYLGPWGDVVVTDLEEFLTRNSETILRLSA